MLYVKPCTACNGSGKCNSFILIKIGWEWTFLNGFRLMQIYTDFGLCSIRKSKLFTYLAASFGSKTPNAVYQIKSNTLITQPPTGFGNRNDIPGGGSSYSLLIIYPPPAPLLQLPLHAQLQLPLQL